MKKIKRIKQSRKKIKRINQSRKKWKKVAEETLSKQIDTFYENNRLAAALSEAYALAMEKREPTEQQLNLWKEILGERDKRIEEEHKTKAESTPA
jgi:hypothetical protein